MLREIHHCMIPTFSGQKLPLLTHGQDFFPKRALTVPVGKLPKKPLPFGAQQTHTNPGSCFFLMRELDNLDF